LARRSLPRDLGESGRIEPCLREGSRFFAAELQAFADGGELVTAEGSTTTGFYCGKYAFVETDILTGQCIGETAERHAAIYPEEP